MSDPHSAKTGKTGMLLVTVNCLASYRSAIAVPARLSLEQAVGYARKRIREIPLGRLEWTPDSDEIDVDGCSFADEASEGKEA